MPYSAASRLPDSSAVTMVMRSGLDADVAQHQRQHALADAAETDENQAVRELNMSRKSGMTASRMGGNGGVY